jgi:hypothetical protein
MGPAVSWVDEMGMHPWRLTIPTVVLMPTNEFVKLGLRIEPKVSVPIVTALIAAAPAAPDPDEDPLGLIVVVSPTRRTGRYGLSTCPANDENPVVMPDAI